ncbi:ankyrin repeat-containing domain protein [Neocallimastix sp. 'constans']
MDLNKVIFKDKYKNYIKLLKRGYNNGKTPLFDVCRSGNKDLVEYLVVKHDADINNENRHGETPLFDACESGNKDLVENLVEEHGTDITKEDKYGKSPLFRAIKNGNNDLAKCLVVHGADINKKNKYGRTPLFYACKKYLVEHGVNINKEKWNGGTPLFDACENGITPLLFAIESGNKELVECLVDHRVDINKEDEGKIPSFNTIKCGNKDLVGYLLENKSDMYKEEWNGGKPLFDACEKADIMDHLNDEFFIYVPNSNETTNRVITDIITNLNLSIQVKEHSPFQSNNDVQAVINNNARLAVSNNSSHLTNNYCIMETIKRKYGNNNDNTESLRPKLNIKNPKIKYEVCDMNKHSSKESKGEEVKTTLIIPVIMMKIFDFEDAKNSNKIYSRF